MPTRVRTTRTTIVEIMSNSAFALGVHEFRAGLPLRDLHSRRTFLSPHQLDDQWNYERGRAWAAAAPKTMPLIIGGRLNPEAVRIAKDAIL